MWRTRHRLFLEPGEVEALAAAARAASAAGPPHPRQLLLAAAAEALEALAEPAGLLVRRAPASIRRRGARVHLLAATREEDKGPRPRAQGRVKVAVSTGAGGRGGRHWRRGGQCDMRSP